MGWRLLRFVLAAGAAVGWLFIMHRFLGLSWEAMGISAAIMWAWAETRP